MNSLNRKYDKEEQRHGKKEAYERKLQAQLSENRSEIDKLKEKAEKAGTESQLQYYRTVEALRSKQDAARDKLDDLRDVSDDAWEDLKSGLEKSWKDFGESISKATSRSD